MTLATRIQSLWRAVVGSEDAASTASFVSVEADTGEPAAFGLRYRTERPNRRLLPFGQRRGTRSRLWTSIHLPCGL